MSEMEAELTAEFSQPLVYIEGPKSRTQLTLTAWEIRVLVRRTITWHLKRLVGRTAVSGKTNRSPATNTDEQGSAFSPEKAGEIGPRGELPSVSLLRRILMGMGVAALSLLIVIVIIISIVCILHYTPDGWEPLALAIFFIAVFGTWIGLREEEL